MHDFLRSTPEDRAAVLGWDEDGWRHGVPHIDHKREAEQAAHAGKYDIAQYHALMRLGDLLEEAADV